MPTTRIKEKISDLIASQVPEFVNSDYPTFVAFLEAYYRFLEQDEHALELVQNARSYNDIDRTASSFIYFFIKQYAFNFPVSAATNQRFLLKKLGDLYESKGSELSFKLFFKILFNTDVSIEYPYDFVLRSSDGRWEQKNSIRVETVFGSVSDITNRFLTYTNLLNPVNNQTYQTSITEIKILSNNLTEIYLDRKNIAPDYHLEGQVIVYDEENNIIFIGIIKPTALSVSVNSPGEGFKIGQIYSVKDSNVQGTFLQITSLDSNSGISSAKVINFGFGYTGNLTVDLDPKKKFAENLPVPKPNNVSTITLNVGSLSKYPGEFKKVNGLLSVPEVCLPDDRLFQPFSYVTNTDLDIKRFYSLAKNVVHPAGKQLYNKVNFKNDINVLSSFALVPTSNIFIDLYDKIDFLDTVSIAKLFNRAFNNTANIIDPISLNLTKSNIDLSVSLSDSILIGAYLDGVSGTFFAEDYTSENYNGDVIYL